MRRIVKQFTQREAHPAIQFVKYAIGGGVATMVDMAVFFFLSWKVFPAIEPNDIVVRLLNDVFHADIVLPVVEEALRGRRFILNSGLAFIFSNLTAYLINIVWVFEPGRHQRHIEIGLFFAVSISSIVLGTALGWAMINFLGVSTSTSYVGKMIAAVLINYVCRKFLVFKG